MHLNICRHSVKMPIIAWETRICTRNVTGVSAEIEPIEYSTAACRKLSIEIRFRWKCSKTEIFLIILNRPSIICLHPSRCSQPIARFEYSHGKINEKQQ